MAKRMQDGQLDVTTARGRIRAARLRLGLTQEQLAERTAGALLGRLRREEVVNVERGKNKLNAKRVTDALTHAFGVSTEDFERYVIAGAIDLKEFLQRRELTLREGPGGPLQIDHTDPHPTRARIIATARQHLKIEERFLEKLRNDRPNGPVAEGYWFWKLGQICLGNEEGAAPSTLPPVPSANDETRKNSRKLRNVRN